VEVKEQLSKQNHVVSISGVDTAKGISIAGGSFDNYRQFLGLFCKEAEERLPLLQTVPVSETLSDFVKHVNSIKSSAAVIGAVDLSVRASGLEAAGWAGDLIFIRNNLAVFSDYLTDLISAIQDWEKTAKEHDFEKPRADYISKPFDPPTFTACIERSLR